jgi:ADP-ribosylglycohydrolase
MLDTEPRSTPSLDFDRVEGMLLGLAIGDALGNTSEGMRPGERLAAYGEIRDYLPNRRLEGRRLGLPSDDSQLAFWTVEQLLEDGEYVPDRLASKFCSGRIFGMGRTMRGFLQNHKDLGLPWERSGPRSAGNGALMRIAPMLLPHVSAPSPRLWIDTALSAMTTHNDTASIASCVAWVAMLWDLLAAQQAPAAAWWLERFVEVAGQFDNGAVYQPRGGRYVGYDGAFTPFVAEVVRSAEARNLTVVEAANEWYSGAYLLETVPSAVYILMKHGNDPEEAVVRAVNDTVDNDTVGAIVGSAVGALHGRRGLPQRWVEGLLGRTRERDDGRVFALIDACRGAWFAP